jgi:hypothetical protein
MDQATWASTLDDVRINACSRCGEDHEHVVAKPMARPFAPPEAGVLAWTHWAPCPTNGDPILLMVL